MKIIESIFNWYQQLLNSLVREFLPEGKALYVFTICQCVKFRTGVLVIRNYSKIILPTDYDYFLKDASQKRKSSIIRHSNFLEFFETLSPPDPSKFIYYEEFYLEQLDLQISLINDLRTQSIEFDLEHISKKDDLLERIYDSKFGNHPLFVRLYGKVTYNLEVVGTKQIFHAIIYLIHVLTEKINETQFLEKHLKDAIEKYDFKWGYNTVNVAERPYSNYKKKTYRNSEHLELALECVIQQLLPGEITKIKMVISKTKKTQTPSKNDQSN